MLTSLDTISVFSRRNLSIWMTMAFQGGLINTGAFLGCQRVVTHTTGYGTYVGSALAKGHLIDAVSLASIPTFFLAGATASAYFVDRRIAGHRQPLYSLMFGLISLAMLLVTWVGHLGAFGAFGGPIEARDYFLLALLAFSAGMQNGTITSAAGAVVRTTHLTGITTDLGLGLVRVISKEYHAKVRHEERQANEMRIGVITFFIFGSTVGAFFFYRFGYWGFLWPAVISMALALLCLNYQLKVKAAGRDRAP
jgi:uncharacterized membrane protein YoaK (UPF0700 family)